MFNPVIWEREKYLIEFPKEIIIEDIHTWDRKIIQQIWNWCSITFIPGDMIKTYMRLRVENTLKKDYK